VVIRLAPDPDAAAPPFDLSGRVRHRKESAEGLHVLIADGVQLWLPAGADLGAPLAAVLPLDRHLPVRLAAVRRLHDGLARGIAAPQDLPSQRRWRLVRMLRALDGRGLSASYREVAEHVLGAETAGSAAWRTAPARDVAIRLCRSAGRLMRGGYLALLRRRS
jgi:hypothetical protein